ncbi:MAG: hypothetical protein GY810_23690 [Aureispira sp.]|nr:hypothetical protein [Aureispira sp.]
MEILIPIMVMMIISAFMQKPSSESEIKSLLAELRRIDNNYGWKLEQSGRLKIDLNQPFALSVEKLVGGRSMKMHIGAVVQGAGTIWRLTVTWECDNTTNLQLTLYTEKLKDKIQKRIGLEDIEIYEEWFDNNFVIQCNQRSFPMMGFSKGMKTKLLAIKDPIQEIRVKRNEINYEEIMDLAHYKAPYRLINLLKAIEYLAESIDNWQPPKLLN